MDGKTLNQRGSGQEKDWRMWESGQSQGRGGHTWSRGCWGWQVLCRSFSKSALKIRNEEKKRENTVGQNEGRKQQEAEKTQCKE